MITTAVFVPDGRLVSGSVDSTIKVWDTSIEDGVDYGRAPATISATDKLCGASKENNMEFNIDKIAENDSGQPITSYHSEVWWVVFSNDGQQLASGSADSTIRVWDISTGTRLKSFPVKTEFSLCQLLLSFSFDGQWLAGSLGYYYIYVWDAITGGLSHKVRHKDILTNIQFNPTTNHDLHTSRGLLSLDAWPHSGIYPPQSTLGELSYHSYHLMSDEEWIYKDKKRVLWLPQEYRSVASAVSGSTIALGCASGRVLILKFSEDGMDSWAV